MVGNFCVLAMRFINGALLFGLLGPPVGSFPISIALIVFAFPYGSVYEFVLQALSMLVVCAQLSYVLGAVPAMVAGALASLLGNRLRSWGWCICVGAGSALIASVWWAINTGSASDAWNYPDVLLMVAPSMFAGVVLSRVIFWLQPD